jgi:hypothetical protein
MVRRRITSSIWRPDRLIPARCPLSAAPATPPHQVGSLGPSRAVGGFRLSCIAFGHRVSKTTRDAAPFEKNLASKFANEKRTAVYHPCLTDLGCRRGPRIFRCSAIFFAEGLTWSCLRIFPNSKTGKQRPGSIRNARVRILSLQPGFLLFREYPFLDTKGPPNAGFSHLEKSLETR